MQNTNRALFRSLYCNRTDFIQSLQGFASPLHNGFAHYSVYPVLFFQNAHQFFAQTGSDVLHETTDYLTNYEFLKKLYNEYQYLSSTFRKQSYIFLIYFFVFCSQSLLCMLQTVYGRRRKACVPAVFGIAETNGSQLSYTSDSSFPTACFRHSIRTGLKLPHSPFSIILSATSAESASL